MRKAEEMKTCIEAWTKQTIDGWNIREKLIRTLRGEVDTKLCQFFRKVEMIFKGEESMIMGRESEIRANKSDSLGVPKSEILWMCYLCI